MTDLQATLDAIDEVAHQECGHCRRPLRADGPSLDFCDDWCQASWLRAKQEVVELVGYREPYDLPVHAYNLVELSSPETTPPMTWPGGFEVVQRLNAPTEIRFTVTVDTRELTAAFERMAEAAARARETVQAAWEGMSAHLVAFDEIRRWEPRGIIDPLQAAVFWAPEEPLWSEPDEAPEPFGADFDFEHRPARTLPDESPPAVMPALPERDWQALVDARMTSTGPERVRRAPRDLGRRR